MTDLHYLALSALLTWIMLLTASQLRARTWTLAGWHIAFGNRDHVPAPSPLAARADRAAHNMLENLLLFVALLTAGRFAGVSVELLTRGAAIFFWARVAYFPVYLAGIPYLRTCMWSISLVGLGQIALAVLLR